MRVLDLFCGGGGASDGYRRTGADVVGVDIDPQPFYPYEFRQADALTVLAEVRLGDYDLIHASPPCQGYSTAVTSRSSRWVPTLGKDEPRLIEPVRTLLQAIGTPYVIENVRGARDYLIKPVCLCGVMFDLPIARHRYFEASFEIVAPKHPACRGIAKRYAAEHGIEYRDMSVTGKGRHAGTSERWSSFLGMDRVMRQHDYAESIPPAYTELIGREACKRG